VGKLETIAATEGFHVKASIRRQIERRKRRNEQGLDRWNLGDCSRPVLSGRKIQYELGERAAGTTCGGISAMHLLVRELGLAEDIDQQLHLLKMHLPYHESDHVLRPFARESCNSCPTDNPTLLRRHPADNWRWHVNRAMRSRIAANQFRVTATFSSWHVTYFE
jgi:hypothetical protein